MPNWVVLLQLHFLEQLSLALLRKDRLFTKSQGLVCGVHQHSAYTHTHTHTQSYQRMSYSWVWQFKLSNDMLEANACLQYKNGTRVIKPVTTVLCVSEFDCSRNRKPVNANMLLAARSRCGSHTVGLKANI